MVSSGEEPETPRGLLSDVLDDPAGVDGAAVDRAVTFLESDDRRTRVTAAWIFGLLASDAPETAVEAVPDVAAALTDPTTRPEAARALAYIGERDPDAVRDAVDDLSDDGLERNLEALSGDLAPGTVVPVADEAGDDGSTSGGGGAAGGGGADHWGWTDGTATIYDDDGHDRGRPPTDAPIEPDPVDLDLLDFEPVGTLAGGDAYVVRKALYRADGEDVDPATLVTFEPAPSASFLAAFDYRMALWASRSDDPGVLPLVAWGTEPTAWFATEHVLAGDVTGLAAVSSADAAAWTLVRVARTLRRAHHRGVVHGGLVPGAVALTPVLSEPGAWAVPRVTHWGLVDLLAGPEGPGGAVPPACLAPEYHRPDELGDVDDATDVFQFGVTAYAALTGRLPFEDADETAPTVPLEASLTLPSDVDPAVPSAVDAVVSKCLAGRRAQRYGTADAMAAELADAFGVA